MPLKFRLPNVKWNHNPWQLPETFETQRRLLTGKHCVLDNRKIIDAKALHVIQTIKNISGAVAFTIRVGKQEKQARWCWFNAARTRLCSDKDPVLECVLPSRKTHAQEQNQSPSSQYLTRQALFQQCRSATGGILVRIQTVQPHAAEKLECDWCNLGAIVFIYFTWLSLNFTSNT